MTSVRSPVFEPASRAVLALKAAAAAGGLVFLVGLLADHHRAWSGYLLGFGLVAGLALAGAFFTAVAYVANAHWAVALRRIPEAMAGTLPAAAALGAGLLFGVPALYVWAHPHEGHGPHLDGSKLAWLSPSWFGLRLVVCFALWIWLAYRLLSNSRAQDADRDPAHTARNYKNAILFVAAFAVTFSCASWDWFLSLDPAWFSTIYALQALAGLATAGLAVVMVSVVVLRDRGPLRGVVRDDHLDDLGKLAIALSLFWVYIGFCQYMLIWYTNQPEETAWHAARFSGAWQSLNMVSLALNWLLPFCVLMPKRARRSGAVIFRVGCAMLLGRVLDLYVLLGPPLMPDGPRFGFFEIAPLLAAAAVFAWAFLRALARAPLLPAGDPHIAQSLSHHC